jgi:hypothetical protein
MKHMWLVIWPFAIKTIGPTQIAWDAIGHTLTYKNSRGVNHDISIPKFQRVACNLVSTVKKQILDLFPSQADALEILDSFRTNALTDDLTSLLSVFEQNTPLFTCHIDKTFDFLLSDSETKHRLKTDGVIQRRNCESWFAKEHALAQHILGTYLFSAGIPPRTFQAANLRYQSSSDGERNFFWLKNRIVIGWPKSKAFNRSIQAMLWSLPQELGNFFLLYYGIIRPIALRIADHIGSPSNPRIKTIMFTKSTAIESRRRKSKPGTKTRIKSGWHQHSTYVASTLKTLTMAELGIGLTPASLRQIVTAIFRKHLSDLIDPPFKQVEKQALAIDLGPTNCLHLTDWQIDEFQKVSQGWQTLLELEEKPFIPPGLHEMDPVLQLESGYLTLERLRVLISYSQKSKRPSGPTSAELIRKPSFDLWRSMADCFKKSGLDEVCSFPASSR